MIIYHASASKFIEDVDSNQIVSVMEAAFQEELGRGIPPAEVSAYLNSLPQMERVIRRAGVQDDCSILIEYKIPLTNFRVDFIIAGEDETGNKNLVIVELKQWQKAVVSDGDGLVETYVGQANRVVTHPSYQALRYKDFMSDFNEAIHSGKVNVHSCAYLHNYERSETEPLLDERYQTVLDQSPIYFRDDQANLGAYIAKHAGHGGGSEVIKDISEGLIKPSKKLIDHVSSMFAGNSEYVLLDEQKVVFETARITANKGEKAVFIVKGGPGTGKSVVSVNLVATLLKDGLNAIFVAPNSSFRNSLIKKLVKDHPSGRIRNIFKGSAAFYNAEEDEFDVLVVDEAHRLKGKGAFMYKGTSQVEDVIRSSKVSIFFIDDDQAVRPEDIGRVQALKDAAQEVGATVTEMELEAQFRCAGAEGYINWLDDIFGLKNTANYDGWDKESFDFKIFDNPHDLKEALELKANAKQSARMLAGYAWDWTSIKEGNNDAEVHDISIPEFDFSMPWNSRKVGTTWAIDDKGIGQVGCIHTSQGLEFDYVGIIIGEDLSYDEETKSFLTDYNKYKDKTGKRGMKDSPEELNKFVRNIYKILMTRGQRGCYVYICDPELRSYFERSLSKFK